MTTLAGFVGDRFNRKWIITLSLMFWSLMTVCMGFVGDWKIFGIGIPAFACVMFFRSIATGGGESFYAPSAYALIAAHHKESRSVALSIHQAALYIGLMCSGVIVAWSLDWLGSWRNVFILFGVAGFLLGVFFVFALKETPDGAKVPVKQTDPAAKSMLKEGLKAYFCNPSALCATAGFIAIVFVNNAYLFWAPKFMAEKFAVDVGEAGKSSMLWHHLFAFGAILLGGIVTDKFVGKMPRFRLGFQIIALLCGAPALVMLGFSSSATMMVAMMSVYGIFRGFFEVNTHASLFDVVDPAYRSTAVGLLNMLAFFFGGLSGVVMGALSEKWGVRGFETGFALMGGTYAVAALLMMVSFFFTFEKNRVKEG
jgi:MFS family permease